MFIVHHILNHKWIKHLLKGKYTLYRMIQTVLVFGVLAAMIGAMVSGIILSRHIFSFLTINGGRSMARSIHMISAYWGFVMMSLHLGFHWSMMMVLFLVDYIAVMGLFVMIGHCFSEGSKRFMKR